MRPDDPRWKVAADTESETLDKVGLILAEVLAMGASWYENLRRMQRVGDSSNFLVIQFAKDLAEFHTRSVTKGLIPSSRVPVAKPLKAFKLNAFLKEALDLLKSLPSNPRVQHLVEDVKYFLSHSKEFLE